MSQNDYQCPRCHHHFPISNRVLHDLRCNSNNNNQNPPDQNYNRSNTHNINRSNIRNDFNNNFPNNNNIVIHQNSFNNNSGRNVSSNTNSVTNPDGTTTVIQTETDQYGNQKITKKKYDRNHNIMTRQTYHQNQNNFNNVMFNNNNFNSNQSNNNNNINRRTETDSYGNTVEITTESLPGGGTKISRITKDRNGKVINSSYQINGGNFSNVSMNMNNMGCMNNVNMDNMDNFNNMINMYNMNFMNNMNILNNMNQNMNQNMNNMNNMLNLMREMLEQNNVDNFSNGVSDDILNNLPSSKLKDPSKLDDDKKSCVICLEEFKADDEVVSLYCLHLFHKTCIFEWLKGHDSCPICKMNINNMDN